MLRLLPESGIVVLHYQPSKTTVWAGIVKSLTRASYYITEQVILFYFDGNRYQQPVKAKLTD